MLAQRVRRWPAIETALSDCPVFGGTAALLYAGDDFSPPPSPEKQLLR